MDKINRKIISKFSKKFNSKKSNIIAKNAISSTSLETIALNRDVVQSINPTFYKRINSDVEVTNQNNSGRCWIFSFLNIIRLKMIEKYNLDEKFEFSQNYLFFWDQFEKTNYFLHNIYNTLDCKNNSRLISILLKEPVQDGGQWNMIVNLVNKYGVIPKDVMEETHQSNNTEKMTELINAKLIKFAHYIREKQTKRDKKTKEETISEMLYQIYTILVMFLGEPPKNFVWKYYSQSKKYCKGTKKQKKLPRLTPLEFYKEYVPFNVNDKIVLINAPMKNKKYYNIYTVDYFNNMVNGEEIRYLNVPMDVIIKSTKKSIDNDEAVWFGCNVSKYLSNEHGLFDDKIYDFQTIFGFNIELDKGYGLEYFQSILNHAMIFKGYDIDNKKNISQWLLENSWGEDNGIDGEYIMSKDWFNKYVYQIVIDKKYLDKNILEYSKKKSINCPLWDPFGLLAIKYNKKI